MSCCGKQRSSMINLTNKSAWKERLIRVKYFGAKPVTIIGAKSKKKYNFSGTQRTQDMVPNDAINLLRAPYFRMDRIVRIKIL